MQISSLFFPHLLLGEKKNLPQISAVVAVAAALLILTRVAEPESIVIIRYTRKSHTPYTLTGHTRPSRRKANSQSVNDPVCELGLIISILIKSLIC